ncbi:MAG: hypothetical protein M3Q69_15285 [Acidobacteriota bacterium]|nr:hypothetical protein [Acidobacteriota bacterium]
MRRLIATLVLLLATSVFGKQRAVRTSPELRVVPVSAPQYVTSHGKQHLLWELLLRNDGNRDVTVQSLDVVNPATGQPLASYSGAELKRSSSTAQPPSGRTSSRPHFCGRRSTPSPHSPPH